MHIGLSFLRAKNWWPDLSPDQSSEPAKTCNLQLIRTRGYAARKPAFWACSRFIHWGDGHPAWAVRIRQWLDGVSGRSGRNLATDAGKTSAGDPEPRNSARRFAGSSAG